MRTSKFISMTAFVTAVMLLSAGLAVASPPDHANGKAGKVWLCHFEGNHEAVTPYTDDRNGADPGFWTVDPSSAEPSYLTGDYIVKYNPESYTDIPAGLNPGQVALCTGNGGEFELVSVNAIGSEDSDRGHRAANLGVLVTYPTGWKG